MQDKLSGFSQRNGNHIASSLDVYIRNFRQIVLLPMFYRLILNGMIIFHKIGHHLILINLSGYLSMHMENTGLRLSHLDRLCFVTRIVPRKSNTNPLNKSFCYPMSIELTYFGN